MDMLTLTAQDALLIIGVLSLIFAAICALADWGIPRMITLRRRKRIIATRQTDRLARWMREEWQ